MYRLFLHPRFFHQQYERKAMKIHQNFKNSKAGVGGNRKRISQVFSRTKLHLVVLTSQMPRYLHSLLRSKFGTDLSKAFIILYVLFLSAAESESGSFPTQKMCTLAIFCWKCYGQESVEQRHFVFIGMHWNLQTAGMMKPTVSLMLLRF